MNKLNPLATLLLAALAGSPAMAGEVIGTDSEVTAQASMGLRSISASEFVFDKHYQVSRLDWNSTAVPTATVDLVAKTSNGWTLRTSFSAAFGGKSDAVDRDWIYENNNGPNGPGDWTGRAHSPDARLDHYLAATVEADRALADIGGVSITAGPGFKFTSVEWTAIGGSYVTSDTGFRDTTGSFGNREKLIRYRQSIPVAFAAVNAQADYGAVTIAGSLQGGAAIRYTDHDRHYITGKSYTDRMTLAPFAGASGTIDYAVTPSTTLFAGAAIERVFRTRGDENQTDHVQGTVYHHEDTVGASFQTVSLSAGLKMRF